MYRKSDEQHTVYTFLSPLGRGLNPNNRWVKLAAQIPWDYVEQEYAKHFKEDGAPAKPARMAFGAMVIQTKMGTSDEKTRQLIAESLYLQYFIGLTEFQMAPPFDASMMHHFRKSITPDMVRRINEETHTQGNTTGMMTHRQGQPHYLTQKHKKPPPTKAT